MSRSFDLLVIGSGPAGMTAAIEARRFGLSVLVVDDQAAPGGQIWRAVETRAETSVGELLGKEYKVGTSLTKSFRASGAIYEPSTQVWQIEPEWEIFMSRAQRAERVQATSVLLATGAQERPAPFPGWTLPGVLTVGAAQILLKTSRHIPDRPVWVAGSGPLPMLYMIQLLRGQGRIAGWLDTTPAGGWRRALPHAARARAGWKDIVKGLQWMRQLKRADFPIIRGVTHLRAEGKNRLERVEYRTADGRVQQVDAELLLIHEGVIPSIHMTQALGCEHIWRDEQVCLAPVVDDWGQTSQPGIFSAGDGAGVGGARAACVRGELAALGIAVRIGKISVDEAQHIAAPLRRRLAVELSTRPLLDALYPPREEIFAPSDETVICRCEELTAGQIREAAAIGTPDPNQIKSLTRAGMGPCQGRQCAYTVAHILAAAQKKQVKQIGFFAIRPPLKPLTLGELASLDIASEST
ncbi:nopaline dehydrogenase [Caballeronia mineralivorans PML1(12)]|uniref:Nopaline dehydrogenase n=1 Tax=Caballeronia mineralivorans PML1(12) TaxID=908627 RepID=A0A0J1FQ80_9BURK|nr:NAD(P)/FAD-dependent oxidoreductase [Caballeronia mineralivorans]KLU21908.1 nopaline dehydrogenase [Caballeronia mineralivorans PML1(12)]